ncbi:hypothetical protein BaRGS_00026844, partial [Batillaria attramentaria]
MRRKTNCPLWPTGSMRCWSCEVGRGARLEKPHGCKGVMVKMEATCKGSGLEGQEG